ncbi:MAG TPA: hypothetical protein VJ570_07885 [Holophagaceae bacterium]|nr:hypothetical protein [Holophagaceae bacterium]
MFSKGDNETRCFFEPVKVRILAQYFLAVSEVNLANGKLMVWVSQQKGATLTPDGAVLLPPVGTQDGPILQAQQVLEGWKGLVG